MLEPAASQQRRLPAIRRCGAAAPQALVAGGPRQLPEAKSSSWALQRRHLEQLQSAADCGEVLLSGGQADAGGSRAASGPLLLEGLLTNFFVVARKPGPCLAAGETGTFSWGGRLQAASHKDSPLAGPRLLRGPGPSGSARACHDPVPWLLQGPRRQRLARSWCCSQRLCRMECCQE
jgi:hypothetical protein